MKASDTKFDLAEMTRLLQPMVKAFENYPFEDRKSYGLWLRQQFSYISHSTRLLAVAAGRFSQDDQALHLRFLEHTREERSHEILAKLDLQALGFTLADFNELPATMHLYRSQYYQIEHIDPRSFLGYVLCLEVAATLVCAPALERVEKAFGKKCGSFLSVHAHDDPDHVEKAISILDGMPEDILREIESNFLMTCAGYTRILEEAAAQLKPGTEKIAA